jgi:hypothetical protein
VIVGSAATGGAIVGASASLGEDKEWSKN